MSAKFITLDGIDGSGKTTQIGVVREWFDMRGLPVCFTREPGGTVLGEKLRNLLLDPAAKVSLHTETLLMFAARRQHLEEVVWPALAGGTHVVCDRFTDATFAYQGGGRGLAAEMIEILQNWVQGTTRPDFTLLLDVPLDVSLARIESSRVKDRFEQEDSFFFKRVRETYLNRAAKSPKHYAVIDSNRDKAVVRAEIEGILDSLVEVA